MPLPESALTCRRPSGILLWVGLGDMVGTDMSDLHEYCLDLAQRAKRAAADLAVVTGSQKQTWLRRAARLLSERSVALAEANRLDIAAAPGFGLSDAQSTGCGSPRRASRDMAKALEEVAALPEPIGEIISSSIRPNGLEVQKVRVPLGVIFFIYESRPNVTADAAALCVKSGNAVILRGGKEAAHSNAAIAEILAEAAAEAGLPADAVQLVATADRAAVGHLLRMPQYIDLAIPRGGESLIRRVSEEARMPVIKHFAGNCHVYLDRSADPDMAERIVDQRQVPADGRLQRGRIAGGARRGGRGALPRDRPALLGPRHRSPRRRADHANCCRRPSRPPKTIMRPSISARSSPSRWSTRSTRRSSTSTATARSTPRRSSPATWPPPGSSPPGSTARR